MRFGDNTLGSKNVLLMLGNMMLNHLPGGPGGIEQFFQQFTGSMAAWRKTLGSPLLTPEVQKKLIDSCAR